MPACIPPSEKQMDTIKFLIDLFLHLDTYLADIISQYGTWTYAILFFVIFMETGFVVTRLGRSPRSARSTFGCWWVC
jgi:hypothetical protein